MAHAEADRAALAGQHDALQAEHARLREHAAACEADAATARAQHARALQEIAQLQRALQDSEAAAQQAAHHVRIARAQDDARVARLRDVEVELRDLQGLVDGQQRDIPVPCFELLFFPQTNTNI